ncbi:MAG: hypothetical protein HYY18_19790 [Planctomycetes bacterium]|nr:hypothetical protein [Planctomycetota bacterium]
MRSLLLLAAAASLASAQERRSYDLRPLTESAVPQPGPRIGFTSRRSEEATVGEEDPGINADDVAEFLQATIAPGTWDGPENGMSLDDGQLCVTAPAETQEKIRAVLELLEARAARVVVIELDAIEVSQAALKGLDVSAGLLEERSAAALLSASGDPARGRIRHQLSVRAGAGVRTHTASVRRRTYLKDFDIEIAQGASVADPVTGMFDEGAVLDVHPHLSTARDLVVLELRFAASRLAELAKFELPAASGGSVEQPRLDLFEMRTAVAIPMGRTLLLAATDYRPETPGWTSLLVVRARLENPVPADANPTGDEPVFRAWDAGALLHLPHENFAGPELGLAETSDDANPGGCIFGDDPLCLGREALMELVGTATGSEIWDTDGLRLALMGDTLVARAPVHVLNQIGDTLARLETRLGTPAALDAWLVALDPAEWASRRDIVTRANGLPEELFSDLLTLARKGDRARLIATSSALGRTGTRFHLTRGRRASFVADYDVEIAQNARAWDPVPDCVDDGLSLDLVLTPATSGRWAVDSRSALATATFEEAFDPKAEGGGRIQTPKCEWVSLALASPVAENRPVLVSTVMREEGGKQEVVLFMVRVRTVGGR